MWDTVPRLLAEHRYLVLGTADPAGDPWVTPVFYAPDGTHRVVWVSAPGSRHSRNIAARPTVSVTIFDTNAPVGGAEAIYLEARAGLVDEHDRPAAVGLLDARLPAGRRLEPEDLGPAGPLWVYQAIVTRHHVLVRGGDPRFDNVTDARLTVEPPT